MARAKQKAKRDGSKSAAVRSYLQDHPNAKPGEVVKALKANGVHVSYNLASKVKGNALATSGGEQSNRPRASANGSSNVRANGTGKSAGEGEQANGFFAAIEFIKKAGGIDNAKQILEQISIIKSLSN